MWIVEVSFCILNVFPLSFIPIHLTSTLLPLFSVSAPKVLNDLRRDKNALVQTRHFVGN